MGAKIAEMKLQAADALPKKKVKEISTILSVQTSVVDTDTDSQSGSGSRWAKITQKQFININF